MKRSLPYKALICFPMVALISTDPELTNDFYVLLMVLICPPEAILSGFFVVDSAETDSDIFASKSTEPYPMSLVFSLTKTIFIT